LSEHNLTTFINTFTVISSPEEFERVFAEVSEFMAKQPGFVQYTLSRHVEADKSDRYVNVALWRDVESWQRAVAHPDFRPHAEQIRARATSVGDLYDQRQFFSIR
jgi:heme-degrading monooxygenase HmoA